MRKFYILIGFGLLYVASVFGQAQVDIPFSASDGSATIQLAVGLDLTATNCLDPDLGESDLPPFPPIGVFECRFDLNPDCGEALTSYNDYRAPGDPPAFPYTDTIPHTLWFQTSSSGIDIVIGYALPLNSKMTLTDQVGGTFLNLGPFEGTGEVTIPGSYTAVFSKAYLNMIYTDIVPVELTSFTATADGNVVQLNWSTASETNNRGFDIERFAISVVGTQWEKIGYVEGGGTTTVPQSYSFTDNNVSNGRYLYRLKQINYDGSYSYSNEVEAVVGVLPDNYSLSQNYPNPFNPTTSIQFQVPKTSDVSIKIYNFIGQEVKNLFSGQVNQGTYTLEWNGMNDDGLHMSSGIYVYRIETKEFIQSRKMILMK